MMNPECIAQRDTLETYLRRFGVEGETAFHIITYHYTICHADTLKTLPVSLTQKWQKSYQRIDKKTYVTDFLNDCIADDLTGKNLALWYQFFIGRRFREASGKFFTPRDIATTMANLLPLRDRSVIMDPTCGGGIFLMEAAHRWKNTPCTLIANDIESSLVELSMLSLSLSTLEHHSKEFLCTDIYDPSEALRNWYGKIDYILANPPFSLQIHHEQFDSPLFRSGYRNSDALFIDIALKLLRKGGRLVCLLPHSIIANKEFSKFRNIVERSWEILGVICLPEGVFQLSAGTTTRADIVILEKKEKQSKKSRKMLFASVPSVSLKLNGNEHTMSNGLKAVFANPEVRKTLKI